LKAEFAAQEKAIKADTTKTDAEKTAAIKALNSIDKISLKALEALYAANGIDDDFKADVKAAYEAKNYNYSYLYATFLDTYLPTYASQWNIGVKLNIGGKDYTKMCVPNIMMFNGEGEGKAELVALAEAEYTYANVNEEGNAQQIAWDKAVKAVFEANPYAKYAPIVAAPEAAPEASAPAAGGSSAPAADAGGC